MTGVQIAHGRHQADAFLGILVKRDDGPDIGDGLGYLHGFPFNPGFQSIFA